MTEYGNLRAPTTTHDLAQRWASSVGWAATIALTYFLTARLSLRLLLDPTGVAVFWPAAGISSGALIALGPRARWSVAAGAMAGTITANLMGDRDIPAAIAFSLCNAAEALIAAGLIQHYFGSSFTLGRLRQVLGLLAAALVAAALSGIGGTIAYKLFHSPAVPMLITWRHWFASDAIGILAVAPVIIGLSAAASKPPRWNEIIEGIAALALLAATTGVLISLPEQPWQTVVPCALLFPILLWLAAGYEPVFAAAGGFMTSAMIVWTTIFGIGHFGAADLPIEDRILQAQAIILMTTLGPLVLAALFAERRKTEARLARAKMLLERERDNKLANVEAITAAIAHEIKQPLASIVINCGAALQLLERTPPDHKEIREALNDIIGGARRTDEAFDGVRTLFRRADEPQKPVDVNELILGAIAMMRGELRDGGVTQRVELAQQLPAVPGNRHQLQEVILNLVHNAIEAMSTTRERTRELRVRSQPQGRNAVVVTIEDSGPGIDRSKLSKIFEPFVTTKPRGMGLGLAICRMIIERHGGRLTASSNGRTGALFSITLPAQPMDDAGKAAQ